MADCEINVTVEDTVAIDITVQDQIDIDVQVEGGVANNYVNEGDKFYFDGPNGDSYLWKNPATGKVEGWRDGVKRFGF